LCLDGLQWHTVDTRFWTHTHGDGLIKFLPFPEDNKNGLIVSNGSEVVCVEGIFFIDQ
jgi:hypothetical protein